MKRLADRFCCGDVCTVMVEQMEVQWLQNNSSIQSKTKDLALIRDPFQEEIPEPPGGYLLSKKRSL